MTREEMATLRRDATRRLFAGENWGANPSTVIRLLDALAEWEVENGDIIQALAERDAENARLRAALADRPWCVVCGYGAKERV